MLGKIETGLLYLMRLVMVLLVLFTLFIFVLWGVEAMRPSKTETELAEVNKTRDWASVKIDDDELKKTTYADFGFSDAEQAKNDGKLAADAAVVAAFAEMDTTLRGAINQNPAARKKLEDDNGEVGLAPAQALPDLVKAMHAKEREGYDAANVAVDAAAAVAAASSDADEESSYQPQPTDLGEIMLTQTRGIISSYGYEAGRAYVLGGPAAFKTLLADPQVQAGISKQTASTIASNLVLNYSMAFNSKAGESDAKSSKHSWLQRLLEPSSLLVFTVLLWSFVFMMMIVVFLRVERHLRAMAVEGKALADRR